MTTALRVDPAYKLPKKHASMSADYSFSRTKTSVPVGSSAGHTRR